MSTFDDYPGHKEDDMLDPDQAIENEELAEDEDLDFEDEEDDDNDDEGEGDEEDLEEDKE